VTLGKSVGRVLWAEVEDDGCGFDPGSKPGGVGLSSMRERVDDLGGELEILSDPGHGTTVKITLSL
jgi:two-component system sensor histidine kinase DegS